MRGLPCALRSTQFLPLPKPAHLVYIKPTVAVVAGVAPRSSVGLKMTAGSDQLERYVIEYYSKARGCCVLAAQLTHTLEVVMVHQLTCCFSVLLLTCPQSVK